MPALRLFAATLLACLLGGVLCAGCNQSSPGGVTQPGQSANLRITNKDSETVHFYVDGGEIGSLSPGITVDFTIVPGFRLLQTREKGDSFRRDQGAFDFTTSGLVEFTYDPFTTVNLRVRNTGGERVHVIVGAVDVGTVGAGGTRDFALTSGRYEIFVRPESQGTATLKGTFNLNSSALTEITAP